MSRTTVILNDELLAEAKKVTGEDVTSRVVGLGLQALVRMAGLKKLAALEGSGVVEMTGKELERLRER